VNQYVSTTTWYQLTDKGMTLFHEHDLGLGRKMTICVTQLGDVSEDQDSSLEVLNKLLMVFYAETKDKLLTHVINGDVITGSQIRQLDLTTDDYGLEIDIELNQPSALDRTTETITLDNVYAMFTINQMIRDMIEEVLTGEVILPPGADRGVMVIEYHDVPVLYLKNPYMS
jgi:hypothetical protein